MTKKHNTELRVSIILILTVALFFSDFLAKKEAPISQAPTPLVYAPVPDTKPLAEPIQVIPATNDVMKKIAWCESQNRQFDTDGTPLRGKINPLDTGKWQLNKKYHLAAAQSLGYDLNTLAGNTAYAYHLYAAEGTKPWNWSKPCWGDPNRVWTKRGEEYWSK